MAAIRFMAIIALVTTATGCGTLPQKRVFFSPHNAADAELYSMSYPATLRASTVFFETNPNIPDTHYDKLTSLRKQLAEKKRALAIRPTGKPGEHEPSPLIGEIEVLEREIRMLMRGWSRPRILAEPPPDMAESLKFLLKLDANSTGKPGGQIDAGTTLMQVTLAAESDIKRHLTYRLNEAFFNEPEIMADKYVDLFKAIVNMKVEPSAPEECRGKNQTEASPNKPSGENSGALASKQEKEKQK